MSQVVVPSKLYNLDFAQWCEVTVAQLKNRDFQKLDFEHLIEEVEGLANRDRKEVESRLRVLLAHLLKRIYVASPRDYRGWENTIEEQRSELELLLKHSPSLRNYLIEVFDDAWVYALKRVHKGYPQVQLPEQWPFSRDLEAILSEELWENS
jgi:hypothetical protein